MLGWALIAVGGVLMVFGTLTLGRWVAGRAGWLDAGGFGRRRAAGADLRFLDVCVYFLAAVLGPLLGGAILIVLGLRELS